MHVFFLILNLLLMPTIIVLTGLGLRLLAGAALPRFLLIPLVFPGVVIHELSHALACFPALAKIQRVTLFRADGSGEVVHSEPRLAVVGQLLISLAPLAGGMIALWAFHELLGRPFARAEVVWAGRADHPYFTLNLLWVTLEALAFWVMNLSLGSWRFWLMLVFGISICLSIVPSRVDFRNAAPGLAVVFVMVAVVFGLLASTALGGTVVVAASSLLIQAQSLLLSMMIAFFGLLTVWLIRKATTSGSPKRGG